jgi:DNA-directed RNA polymerase subunit RPC12/RpoP
MKEKTPIRCRNCGWKFIVLTKHDPNMEFFCPHCGSVTEGKKHTPRGKTP